MSAEMRRLYRSRKERIVGGVCGGLGEFFGLDPTIVRLILILAIFLGLAPAVLVAYILLMIVVPEQPITPAEEVVDIQSPVEP